MDDNTFGRYGVLRFMRRHEETVIASYPIDDDELTFGCDPSCSVRLYYPTVSPLHAKIIFQERKAFIQVFGLHGIVVDKCQVFPASATSHTTVPLTNISEVEINKKRFRFEYPPKALRPVLAFTPPPNASKSAQRRVLRLSMIQSAQVFTPRPDPDPRVNLRVLQTPIRLNSSPLKPAYNSPRLGHGDQRDEECGTPIRLVEGNRPQVVEEEQDLVILEEVDAPEHIPQSNSPSIQGGVDPSGFVNPMQGPIHAPPVGGPYPAPVFPLSPSHQLQQFQTPRRRLGRPSLHRAVLIRSAQRAVMRVEMEKEQEEEEREVEEHVMPVEEQMEVDEEDQHDQDANFAIEEFDEEVQDNGDGDSEDPGLDPENTAPVFGWRMGLETFKSGLQALRSRSTSPEKNQRAEGDVVESHPSGNEYDTQHSFHDVGDQLDQDEELEDAEDEESIGDVTPEPEVGLPSEVGARAVSVSRQFTPQRPHRPLPFMTPQVPKANGDLSLADRVRGRVSMGSLGRVRPASSWRVLDPDQSTPTKGVERGQRSVSDSERQAIKERRRSALAQPDMFFGGTIPGSRRNSLGSGTPVAKVAPSLASPSKAWAAIKEDEEETETTSLLEKMKEVVEGMQRRRSVQPEAMANVSVSNRSEEGDKDEGRQDEALEDEATAEEPVRLQTDPREAARSFPATPHMSDLKHVFSENRAANMPSSYAGVRRLFREERAPNLETPRLDGVREMFIRAREREPSTPIFEGVDEMLATPAGYFAREVLQNNEVESENMEEPHVPSSSAQRPRAKSVDQDHPAKPSSQIATSGVRSMHDGRVTPTDVMQSGDDELTPDAPLDKSSEHGNTTKGSIAKRTNRRAEAEVKDTALAPTKLPSRARKVITPEVTEQAPAQPNAVAPRPGPARRSRMATKSTESATTESELAKPTRKMTTRGPKAGTTVRASPEPDAEPEAELAKGGLRRGTRNRSQSVEVAPAPVPAPALTKRRVGVKSKKAVNNVTQDAPAEDPPVGGTARRGKTKAAAAETEDESTGTGTSTLRVARGGRRTPNGTSTGAAGAASNRVAAVATTGKGRMFVGIGTSSGKSTAREKENTPERVRVKDEEDEKVPMPMPMPVAAKAGRARKLAAAAAAVSKVQSESEKDVTAPKMRAPRRRAASGKK